MSLEEDLQENQNKKIRNLFFPNKKNFEKIIKYLEKCESSIHVCMYQITHDFIMDVLIDLAKKGKNINIVMDQHQDQVEEKRSEIISKLLVFSDFKINMALRFGEGLMHNKFCVIDEKTIICGSANWTFQAFSNNEEYVQIIKDKHSAKQFLKQFKKIWDKSKTIKLEDSKIIYIPNEKCIKEQQKNKRVRQFIRKDKKKQNSNIKMKNRFILLHKIKQQIKKNCVNKQPSIPKEIIQIVQETNNLCEEGKENINEKIIQNQDHQNQVSTNALYEHLQSQFKFKPIWQSDLAWSNNKIISPIIKPIIKINTQSKRHEKDIIVIDEDEKDNKNKKNEFSHKETSEIQNLQIFDL